jgi:L-aspartate oxidase
MWEHAGLVRNAEGLGSAASVLDAWGAQTRTPRTEHEHENENLLLVAQQLVAAALERRESVGAHYRSDVLTAPAGPALAGAAGTHPAPRTPEAVAC